MQKVSEKFNNFPKYIYFTSKDAQACVRAESLLSPVGWLSFGKLEQVADKDKEVVAAFLLLSVCLGRWILGHVCGFGG